MPRQTQKQIGFDEGFEQGRQDGLEEGIQKGRKEMLDWLEQAYVNDQGRPDRGTPKAEAILEIARAAGAYLRSKGVK